MIKQNIHKYQGLRGITATNVLPLKHTQKANSIITRGDEEKVKEGETSQEKWESKQNTQEKN